MAIIFKDFDCICDYPSGVIQIALHRIEERTLELAMLGASPQAIATIEAALSEFGKSQLRENVLRSPGVDPAGVKEAQATMILTIEWAFGWRIFSAQFVS